MSLGGLFRAVRQLGLRSLAATIGAMLALNLSVLGAAGYLDARDARRAENADLTGPPVLTQAIAAAALLDQIQDAATRRAVIAAVNSPMLRVSLIEDFETAPPVVDPKPVFVPILETFRSRLDGRPFSVFVREAAVPPWWRLWEGQASIVDDLVLVLRLADGGGLVVEAGVDYRRRVARLAFVYLVGAIGLALVGLIAWASVSYAQPLGRLAAAATRFGADLDAEPVPETGPKPVRDLAATLNAMRRRLRELVAERTSALAAIAHDMRTYLTRLRLRAEFIEDATQRARAVRDLGDMTQLLEDALSLGEAETRPAEREPLDLAAFLEDLVERRRGGGAAAALFIAAPATVVTDRRDVARALNNLLDNALRYAGAVELRLDRAAAGGVVVAVLDHGPGVPEDRLGDITKPFTRLESSRSRDTGGAGLGLAIALARAARAGATLTLANRPEGGLAAELIFPPERVAASG